MNSIHTEEIFIGFRNEIGITDLRGLERYLKKERFKNVYILCRKKLTDPVEAYLYWHIEPLQGVKIIVTNDFRKAIIGIKNKYKGKKIKVQDLNDFSTRALAGRLW